MRPAAALVARRRGSSIRMRRSPRHGASSRASGTSVVLPAPGGAISTTLRPPLSAVSSAGRASATGSSNWRTVVSHRPPPPARHDRSCRTLSPPFGIHRLERASETAYWNGLLKWIVAQAEKHDVLIGRRGDGAAPGGPDAKEGVAVHVLILCAYLHGAVADLMTRHHAPSVPSTTLEVTALQEPSSRSQPDKFAAGLP